LRKIKVTTANGSVETIELKESAARARPGFARVCLVNKRPGQRALIHAILGINPLNAPKGGAESCANFPASLTISFVAQAGGRPAALDNARNIDLSPFDGRRVDFIWN
jgi:hypothetical protein